MSRSVFLFLVLLPLTGCGPRLEVARDRVLAQADRLLGEIEVKRRQIDPAIGQAETAISQLARSRVEVQVRAAQLSADLARTHDRLSGTDRSLARLRDLLAEEQPAEIAGTTYSLAQLRGMASRAISAKQSLTSQTKTLQTTKDRLESVVTLLETREQGARNRLSCLKGLLSEIDAKAVALKAVQEAARIADDAGALDFEALEQQIHDLEAKIDGELSFNEETLKQTTVESDFPEVILSDTGTTEETLAAIEKLLGT